MNISQVVQAYLLLSTVETIRGNEEAGKRYLDHAHTMHNGNAMGPEGHLLPDRAEQEECLDLVFQIYGQPDGCVGHFSSGSMEGGPGSRTGVRAGAARFSGSAAAVDQMIAQAMSPPSDSQSGPLKALKYLSTACGLSSEVFDPTNKCVTVKQYLGEMDAALKVLSRERKTELRVLLVFFCTFLCTVLVVQAKRVFGLQYDKRLTVCGASRCFEHHKYACIAF